METFKDISGIVIQLLKVLIWPLITLLGIYFFKDSIINFIYRIKEIGYGDKTLKINQQKSAEHNENVGSANKVFQDETDRTADDAIKTQINYDIINDQEKISKLLYL
jgi:hypothetical protein